MTEHFRETASSVAGGQANEGQGKLALVPNPWSSPPMTRGPLYTRSANTWEHALIEHMLTHIRTVQPAFSRALLVDYYVSLKTNPFVVLAGPEGRGKTELVELFAESLVGASSSQYALISSAARYPGTNGSQYYQELHERFSSWRFLELLQEAADPSNIGKAYFVCFDALQPAELQYYFASLVHVSPDGRRWLRLPGSGENQLLPIAENVYITATVDTDVWSGDSSLTVLRHAGLIEFRTPQLLRPPAARVSTPPPVGYQRLWLRAAVRDVSTARNQLVQLLGTHEFSRLHCSPSLAQLLWRGGVVLSSQLLHEITTYIANSFDSDGIGLFDPINAGRNAQIAYDAQVIQRVLWKLHAVKDYELRQDLSAYLDAMYPHHKTIAPPQQAIA